MRVWVCIHEHKHGSDVKVLWQEDAPSAAEMQAALDAKYEEGLDYQYIRRLGPFDSSDSLTVDEKTGYVVETEVLQALVAGAPPLVKAGDVVIGDLKWAGLYDDICQTNLLVGDHKIVVEIRVVGNLKDTPRIVEVNDSNDEWSTRAAKLEQLRALCKELNMAVIGPTATHTNPDPSQPNKQCISFGSRTGRFESAASKTFTGGLYDAGQHLLSALANANLDKMVARVEGVSRRNAVRKAVEDLRLALVAQP